MRAYEFLYEKALVPNELGKRENLRQFFVNIEKGEQFELVSGGTVVLDKEFLTPERIKDMEVNKIFPRHPKGGHGWPIVPKSGVKPMTPISTVNTDVSNDDETDDNEKDFSSSEWIRLSDLQKTQEYQGPKGVEETTPIKPSDLIPDENYHTATELKNILLKNLRKLDQKTYPVAGVIIQAIKQPNTPIKNAWNYKDIIQKYAGEYLGALALITGNITDTGATAALKAFDETTFNGSLVKFPRSTTQKLIDSYIQMPLDSEVKISSKQKSGCGAASALSGLLDVDENGIPFVPNDVAEDYPDGAWIIKTLAKYSQIEGPLIVSVKLGIITEDDKDIILNNTTTLRKATAKSQINFLSNNLLKIINEQRATSEGTHPNYRVLFHLMMAITILMTNNVNSTTPQFGKALLAMLNKNSYMQILTDSQQSGANDLTLSYSTKFPAVFTIPPKLWTQKMYYATGFNGKAGFRIDC